MGELFKLFGGLANPLKWKLIGLLAGALLLTNAVNFFVTKTVYYNKGVNTAKVALADYQTQVARLQIEVNKATGKVATQVITRYVTRIKYVDRIVKGNTEVITKYVAQPVDVNNQPVKVPMGWVYAHNQAAKGLPIDPTKAADTTPTKVTFAEALAIISENYGAFHKMAAQLTGWQDYYKGLQQVYENYKNTELKLNDKK
jgi:hypothetical protein